MNWFGSLGLKKALNGGTIVGFSRLVVDNDGISRMVKVDGEGTSCWSRNSNFSWGAKAVCGSLEWGTLEDNNIGGWVVLLDNAIWIFWMKQLYNSEKNVFEMGKEVN